MADKVKKDGLFRRIVNFFKATKSEFKKVTWPTKKHLLNNTTVVIAALVLIGLVIFGLDTLFTKLAEIFIIR